MSPATPRSPARGPLLLLGLGLFLLLGTFAHGYVENTDGEASLHAARALWQRGDLGLRADAADGWEAERAIAAGRHYGMAGRNGAHYLWFPVGHQLLLVPCVAAGELLARWLPGPEAALRARLGPLWGEMFWARFLASFLPVLAAAGAALMLHRIAHGILGTHREALLVMAVAVGATQFLPGSSETLSDMPGAFLLLACAALVFDHHAGRGAWWTAFLAGVLGGLAVLVRYPHAVPVAVLGILLLRGARGRARDALGFVLGGLPALIALLAANWLRFGDPLETGYSAGVDAANLSFPLWWGVPLILLAPGKGALWFSPPLWLALGLALRHLHNRVVLAALATLILPLVVAGRSASWAAGQCWGIRYVTPSVVLLLCVVFAIARPWRTWPKAFAAFALLGVLISLGGVLAPYRGHQELAGKAARVVYAEEVARGEVPENDLPNRYHVHPRFSPLHTHWIYAGLNLTGRMAEGGAANTTLPLFGVEVPGPVRPAHEEDLGFRHWWMRYVGLVGGPDALWLFLPWAAATLLCLVLAVRRLCAIDRAALTPST